MQDLVAGECGADNPMMDLVKHFTREKGQGWQDAAPGGPPQAMRGPRNVPRVPPGRLGAQRGGGFFTDVGGALGEDLRRMRLDPRHGGAAAAAAPGPAVADWASEFSTGPMMHGPAPAPFPTGAQRAMFDEAFMGARRDTAAGWASAFSAGPPTAHPMGAAARGGPHVMEQQQRAFEQSWQVAQTPHDWAEQFLKYDDVRPAAAVATEGKALTAEQRELQEAARQLLAQSEDPKLKNSKFMDFVQKIGSGELSFPDSGASATASAGAHTVSSGWADEFGAASAAPTTASAASMAAAWREAGAASAAASADPFASAWGEASQRQPEAFEAWADAFASTEGGDWAEQFAAGGGAAAAEAAAFEEAWGDAARETGLHEPQVPQPPPSEYVFEEHNPFLAEPATYDEALQNAKEALYAGALSTAILWAEAAVQKDKARADGWEVLGQYQAENEQEVQAITALQSCVRADPARSAAHLALAVSFTNEMRFVETYSSLEDALMSNPVYAKLPGLAELAATPVEPKASGYMPQADRHAKVLSMYLKAAQLAPAGFDADVQVGLGVLFNVSNEYSKAVDCFRAALQSRPDDAALWNKLGATLANGNRSAEAVDAYARALELQPGYIRARYNLGISCINLKVYKDAAEHFLAALKMQQLATQDSSRRNMSETIWNSLRMTLLMSNNDELGELCRARDLEPFKAHFDF
eukprot:m.86169 g.86169  ORF g.86169 m.86169 type:complete len:698 (+) comp9658_c1_seq1:174-2267(+)